MSTGGEAFGRPGMEPRWTSSSKEGIGTALADASPAWFTLAFGIINEIYFPRVDCANTRDVQYLVTDGRTFFHEERRDLDHRLEYADERALAFRQTNSDPAARYRIVKETITDTRAPVVLVRTRFEPLQPEANDYRIFMLAAPHLANQGMNNSGRALTVDNRACLAAERRGTALAIAASTAFRRRSCGFVGTSDGWTDLHQNLTMDWEFESATDGNIALMAEIDTSQDHEWTLAIGFGVSVEEAARAAFSSLDRGWMSVRREYVGAWRAYCDSLFDLSRESGDQGRTYYTSAMLLRAHEDRHHKGAVCASLSIPWGEIHGDQDIGGYHLIWPRDLCQAAGAALAAGDRQLPRRVLRYLASIQHEDGGMPQNCWVDGRSFWTGIQLDEAAFPLMLAWRLETENLLDGFDPYPMAKAGAGYIIKHGPASPEERWEEDPGVSPSTLVAEIAALVCVSEMATRRGDRATARLCLSTALYWAANVERWTYTTGGKLLEGHPAYYVRLVPVEPDVLEAENSSDTGLIHISNVPEGQSEYPVSEIIDGGFLELVRYGVRDARDPHILRTLPVYDAVLKAETPCGPAWHRYNHDGYGQKANGDPFDGTGIGRAWPLLTGERAHYELAAGGDVKEYLKAIECFANSGAMIPEQVWDAADIPEKRMFCGRPTGSAMPLVWAHAEYIKLLRSARDHAVFDLIEPVRSLCVKQYLKCDLQIWSFNHKLRSADHDKYLRIETYAPARLHWSADDWASANDTDMADEGLEVYAYQFAPGSLKAGATLKFTFFYSSAGHWEGRDFSVTIV